jgi:thiamine-monophosphate kinase
MIRLEKIEIEDIATTISAFGEKRLIADFIRPLFNRENSIGGVGDDCAMLDLGDNRLLLLSTDRVPADLTAFRLGILDFRGLGRYLACLNLSDIAACGGKPQALLLNLGMPADLRYADFQELCRGFGDLAAEFECQVLGGDITHSDALSISATCVGQVPTNQVLTRRGACPGDAIFLSAPLGLTPAALAAYLRTTPAQCGLNHFEVEKLRQQFTAIRPRFDLSHELVEANACSSCMDNTDGIGQSLSELAAASGVAFVVDPTLLQIPPLVETIAAATGDDPLRLAFGAGADFSLVGTLRGDWSADDVNALSCGSQLQLIGSVEAGAGVWVKQGRQREPLKFEGWNYFTRPPVVPQPTCASILRQEEATPRNGAVSMQIRPVIDQNGHL